MNCKRMREITDVVLLCFDILLDRSSHRKFFYNCQNLIEITLRPGCSSVHFLHVFRPSFPTGDGLLQRCFCTPLMLVSEHFIIKANFPTFLVVLILASPICDSPTLHDSAYTSCNYFIR